MEFCESLKRNNEYLFTGPWSDFQDIVSKKKNFYELEGYG